MASQLLRSLLAAAAAVSAGCAFTESRKEAFRLSALFHGFLEEHGRSYEAGSREYELRKVIFEKSLAKVEKHNADPERFWDATVNFMSDFTTEELKRMTGYKSALARARASSLVEQQERRRAMPEKQGEEETLEEALADDRDGLDVNCQPHEQNVTVASLPASKDYLHLTMAKPEKIRAQECSNCWAAATSALMEAHHELYRGSYKAWSDNEVTACTPNPFKCGGNGGCDGNIPELAMEDMLAHGMTAQGSTSTAACPKDAKRLSVVLRGEPAPHEWSDGYRCAEGKQENLFKGQAFGFYGWVRLPKNKYEPLMSALVNYGPVAVAVDPSWTDYKNGVYNSCPQDATITHSVVALGYGETDSPRTPLGQAGKDSFLEIGRSKRKEGVKYWLLQNSWGSSWGEKGHARVIRESEESYCGTDKSPRDGVACEGSAPTDTACGHCGMLYDAVLPLFHKA